MSSNWSRCTDATGPTKRTTPHERIWEKSRKQKGAKRTKNMKSCQKKTLKSCATIVITQMAKLLQGAQHANCTKNSTRSNGMGHIDLQGNILVVTNARYKSGCDVGYKYVWNAVHMLKQSQSLCRVYEPNSCKKPKCAMCALMINQTSPRKIIEWTTLNPMT